MPLSSCNMRLPTNKALRPDESVYFTSERSRMILRTPSACNVTISDFNCGAMLESNFSSLRRRRVYFSCLSTEYFIIKFYGAKIDLFYVINDTLFNSFQQGVIIDRGQLFTRHLEVQFLVTLRNGCH